MRHRIRIWKIGSLVAVITIAVLLTTCGDAGEPTPPGGVDADLINLTLSSGSLLPVFAADTSVYSAFIDSVTSSITVTPTTSSAKAKCEVRCDGGSWAEVLSGSPCPSLTMNIGTNTVEVRVTAEDGMTTKTYTIAVYRGIMVPDEFTTIQEAIDETADGDWVLVRPDTYTENITFPTDRSITVRSINGPGTTIIDGDSNGSSVVTFSTSIASPVLDGFTITNGYKTSVGGGGIYIYQNDPTITNCIITGNTTDLDGAGIYCDDASPTITGCTISTNEAPSAVIGSGGGMYNNLSSPIVSNCTFEANTAGESGGGMYNAQSSPTVTNCTFSENSFGFLGGGMYNIQSSPTVTNCTFSANTTTTGTCGGMYNSDSSPTLVNCIFHNNYDSGSFYGNDMVNDGNSASPTVTNCTFVNGSTPSMYNMSSASPAVTNCIFWGGFLSDMIVNSSASPVVTYSAFDTLSYTGTGNITILNDPSPFVDAWGGDLHLKPSSPCIDAGDNSAGLPDTDIDGDARRIDDPAVDDTGNGTKPIVDMGADEYSP